MSLRSATRTRLGYVRLYPVDLATVSLAAVAAYFLVTTYGSGSTLRLLVTFPLVLFLPGYALVSFLFPATARPARENAHSDAEARPGGIDTVERLALAVALSLALVPMIVIPLALTEWGLYAEPAAAAFTAVTVGFAQLGVVRRLLVPEPERYTVSPLAALDRFQRRREEATLEAASSVVLAFAIVVAGVAMAGAFAAPNSATGFTELGLYTEDEDGELIAGDLPSTVGPGEEIPLTVVIESNEGETVNYTVVIQEAVIEDDEVVERNHLTAFGAWSWDGGVVKADRNVTPTVDEGTVRIAVLLYEEDAPADPTRANADEDVYFWVTVGEDVDELADAIDIGDETGDADAGAEADGEPDEATDTDVDDDGTADVGGGEDEADDVGEDGADGDGADETDAVEEDGADDVAEDEADDVDEDEDDDGGGGLDDFIESLFGDDEDD